MIYVICGLAKEGTAKREVAATLIWISHKIPSNLPTVSMNGRDLEVERMAMGNLRGPVATLVRDGWDDKTEERPLVLSCQGEGGVRHQDG